MDWGESLHSNISWNRTNISATSFRWRVEMFLKVSFFALMLCWWETKTFIISNILLIIFILGSCSNFFDTKWTHGIFKEITKWVSSLRFTWNYFSFFNEWCFRKSCNLIRQKLFNSFPELLIISHTF